MNNIEKARQWIKANEPEIIGFIGGMIEGEGGEIFPMSLAADIVVTACDEQIYSYWYWSKTVVGKTQYNKIWYNTRSVRSVTDCIDFIIHESCHINDMRHDEIKWYKRNRKEVEASLVYRTGYAIGDMYEGGM